MDDQRLLAVAAVLVGRWAVREPERSKNSRKKSVSVLGRGSESSG